MNFSDNLFLLADLTNRIAELYQQIAIYANFLRNFTTPYIKSNACSADANFKLILHRGPLDILLPNLNCRQLSIATFSHATLMLKFIVPISLANAKEQYALNNRLMIYGVYLLKATVRLHFITSNCICQYRYFHR